MKLAGVLLGLCLVLALPLGSRAAEEATPTTTGRSPVLVVRPIRADLQLERLIALFEGSPAPHPAAALARWRQATGRHEGLSKAAQALIALLNPDMVPELRSLEHACFALDPTAAPMRWWAQLPDDDGTLAAVGTALALTDGRSELPLGPWPVDRLGPVGSPLMATRPGGGVALAVDRATLEQALEPWPARVAGPLSDLPESGWAGHLDLMALPGTGPGEEAEARPELAGSLLRAGLALRDAGCLTLDLFAGIEGDRLRCSLTSHFPEPRSGAEAAASLDLAWLDWIPAREPSAALVMALPSGPAAWDRVFALADRLEKLDPARAGAAGLRSRLNLLALTAGLWPEGDLYPALGGLTFSVVVDAAGQPSAGAVVLHARTPEAARRLADRAIRPLLRRFAGLAPAAAGDELAAEGPPILLGLVEEKPCEVAQRGSSLLLAWGPGYARACLDAYRNPDSQSAAVHLRSACAAGQPGPHRLGIAWPARLPTGDDQALAAAQRALPPIVWSGTSESHASRDVLTCTPLKPAIQAFLEQIPLAETASGAAP